MQNWKKISRKRYNANSLIMKNKKLTHLLMWITAYVLVIFFAVRIYYRATDDFSPSSITLDIPRHTQWQLPSPTISEQHTVQTILNQPFSYLGKGSQSYVFLSEDGDYVLKFFKRKHLQPSRTLLTIRSVPFLKSYSDHRIKKLSMSLTRAMMGYKNAYEMRKDECGLVFVHLNKFQLNLVPVLVKDKMGWEHHIDLNQTLFILQKKAKTTKEVLSEALDKKDVSLAKRRIRQVLDHYHSEYKAGVYDQDYGILKNKGFIGEKPILLDAGKLIKTEKIKDPKVYRGHLEKNVRRLSNWLRNNYPTYHKEIVKDIDIYLSEEHAIYG